MSYSYYEIYTTTLRAFSGMGFPYGADEDAAFIIAWLELNKLNGVKLLVKSINKIDNQYNGNIKIDNKKFSINLKNSSVLMKGPSLIDYYESQLNKSNRIELIIDNCIDPYFFIPLLYKTSISGNFSQMIFFDKNNQKKIFIF